MTRQNLAVPVVVYTAMAGDSAQDLLLAVSTMTGTAQDPNREATKSLKNMMSMTMEVQLLPGGPRHPDGKSP
jgi:hypothetical protein